MYELLKYGVHNAYMYMYTSDHYKTTLSEYHAVTFYVNRKYLKKFSKSFFCHTIYKQM